MPDLTLDVARRHFAHLPEGLIAHLERVSTLARHLALRWDAEPERCALAGFLHDIARADAPRELLRRAKEHGFPLHPVEEMVPVLLHGPFAAHQVREVFWLKDEDVLNAICWHSTGRYSMGLIEKIVLLADKLDPEKDGYYPGLEDLPQLAEQDLDRAVLRYLEWQTRRLLEEGGQIHPAAIEARNFLLQRVSEKQGLSGAERS